MGAIFMKLGRAPTTLHTRFIVGTRLIEMMNNFGPVSPRNACRRYRALRDREIQQDIRCLSGVRLTPLRLDHTGSLEVGSGTILKSHAHP